MGRRAEVREHKLRVMQYERDQNVAGLIQELDTTVQGRTQTFGLPRGDAARALGRIGDPRAIPHLIELRNDPEYGVRMDAFQALGLLKAKEAVGILVEGLDDPKSGVRECAAISLGRIGDPTAIPRLREVVESDSDGNVRLCAVEALLILGDMDAREQLPAALRGVGWRSRGARWERLKAYSESGGGKLEPFFTPGEL